jgi:TPR repeat protein
MHGQYIVGWIVDRSANRDGPTEARKWFLAAAEQGHDDAEFELAARLMRGTPGAAQAAEAAQRLRVASDRGHAPSRHQLALLHLSGMGVTRSDTEAALLLRPNADGPAGIAGDRSAGVLGALIFERRLGPGDLSQLEEARRYLYRAANSNDTNVAANAKPLLATVDQRLGYGVPSTTAQLSASQTMVAAAAVLFGYFLLRSNSEPVKSADRKPTSAELDNACYWERYGCEGKCLMWAHSPDGYCVRACNIDYRSCMWDR